MKFLRKKKSGSANGQMGLTILGSISAFSLWSAINPSFFTIREFSSKQSEHNVRFGMKLGLALCVLLGAGLWLGYGSKGKWPAILTAATGVGLYGAYELTLGKSHINNPSGKSIARQAQSEGASGAPQYDLASFCAFCFKDGKPVSEECARICGGGPWNQTSTGNTTSALAQAYRTISGGV
jgi:hypothetical protein